MHDDDAYDRLREDGATFAEAAMGRRPNESCASCRWCVQSRTWMTGWSCLVEDDSQPTDPEGWCLEHAKR